MVHLEILTDYGQFDELKEGFLKRSLLERFVRLVEGKGS
jgi:hypothetical protein